MLLLLEYFYDGRVAYVTYPPIMTVSAFVWVVQVSWLIRGWSRWAGWCVGGPGKLVNAASVWILCNVLLVTVGGLTQQPWNNYDSLWVVSASDL